MQIDKSFIDELLLHVNSACDAIMNVYQSDFKIEIKDDHSPVTKADKISSEIITTFLSKTNALIISEEENKPQLSERLNADFIWLVDPLDGTNEFIRKNGEFCINIALIHKQKPIFGLIGSPTDKKILLGGKNIHPHQFKLTDKNWNNAQNIIKPKKNTSKGLIFSRSHFSPGVSNLIQKIEEKYGTLRLIKKGSALKFFDLVNGNAEFYPRMSPTMEWDIAAGQAIYETVGGEVLNMTKLEPLKYNKPDLTNPNFIAKPKHIII